MVLCECTTIPAPISHKLVNVQCVVLIPLIAGTFGHLLLRELTIIVLTNYLKKYEPTNIQVPNWQYDYK